MNKTEVYSWRIDPEMKSVLEHAARVENTGIAQLLDRIVSDWLARGSIFVEDEEVQRRLHKAAVQCFGKIRGGDPHRAEKARQRIRFRDVSLANESSASIHRDDTHYLNSATILCSKSQ
jgi:hypothetical protein